MSKKFVRGITDIKTINNQDFDTNNVNDLLSDGQHNYIHRKKNDGSEEYHNLTNNIKTLEAEDNGLLTVRNYNNSTNSAKLTVHHDQAKSQLLGSPDQTINVQNGENGSAELTTVDINPSKVLTHDNLETSYGISKKTAGNKTTLGLEYTRIWETLDLNNLVNGRIRGADLLNAPSSEFYYVSSFTESNYCLQEAIKLTDNLNTTYRRTRQNGVWGAWREQVGDKSEIDTQLSQKQNTLTSNSSIGVDGTGLRQLYTNKETYTHENGTLIIYSKSVANSTSISTADEEFHFFVRLNKGTTTASFTLNEHDTEAFNYIMTEHGINNEFNLNNSIFKLNGSTLEFVNNSTGVTYNNFITTFTYLIPSNPTQSAPTRVEKGEIGTVEKLDEIVDETVETVENVEKEQTE